MQLMQRGAVLCAAAGHTHVHGSCRSSPYKVVLISPGDKNRPIACVYSSETGKWGNLIPAVVEYEVYLAFKPGVLVGNVLYWLSEDLSDMDLLFLEKFTDDIVEFDLDRQSLAVIKGPPCLNDSCRHQIIQAEDGDVGLAMLSYPKFELWQRKVNCHGDTTWLLWKTVQMDTILGIPPLIEGAMRKRDILGYDEDNGAVFLYVDGNVYVVQLKSMQSRKIHETNYTTEYHPFTSFYAPGIAIADGCDGAEMLDDRLV